MSGHVKCSSIIRPVSLKDVDWIWELMNQGSVRNASFSTKRIGKEENRAYWKRKLEDKGFRAWTICSEGKPVGLVRVENGTVSIAVSESHRRKGLAFRALSELDLEGCRAEVLPENRDSLKLFLKLGFREVPASESAGEKGTVKKIVLEKKAVPESAGRGQGKVGCIVQARMGSTRLPGKTLKEINGKPVLGYVLDRLGECETLDKVIVATTVSGKDDAILDFCERNGFECFRGSEENVLERFFECAKQEGFDVIVRVTADCPLIDPATVDLAVKSFMEKGVDYLGNAHLRTFPRGLDVEVFSFEALERAHRQAKAGAEREHVTLFFYSRPEIFRVGSMEAGPELRRPELRLCIDTEKDFELLRQVFAEFRNPLVGVARVIEWLDSRPELRKLNVEEEKGYRQDSGVKQRFEQQG